MGRGSSGALFGSGFSLQTRKKKQQCRNAVILRLDSVFPDEIRSHVQHLCNFISPVLDDVIQQRRYGRPLGRGLLVQKTPRAVLAHHKLCEYRHESTRCRCCVSCSKQALSSQTFPPEAFYQTSGFRCWRTSRRRAGPAPPCGSHTCQLK